MGKVFFRKFETTRAIFNLFFSLRNMAAQLLVHSTFFWSAVLVIILSHAQGFSSVTFKDYSLKTQSYEKMFTVDWFECVSACSQDSLCSSYTYQYNIPTSAKRGLCELYDCGMDQCITLGKTLVFNRGYVFQQIKPSRNRSKCIQELDKCSSNPCVNNGTCIRLVSGYECVCSPGYNGQRCENDIDECASTPCQNGGSCIDKTNGFICNCQDGYTGKTCEVKHEGICIPNTCYNGGTCHTNNGVYWCVCLPSHSGYNCESVRVE